MAISTTLSDPNRRWGLIWRAAAALTLLIFLWQWPFFLGDGFGGFDLGRVWGYAVNHLYVLAWMLLVTSFSRTLPLRTVAAFWFVGVFPVMALILLVTRPIDALLGGGELASSFLGPVIEDLIKPLPVLAFFAYRVWRRNWQLSASDGLLLGFVVGAGTAFHEDAAYDRVWGDGFDGSTWGLLLPTIGSSRSALLPGHDVLTALVGVALGIAFVYRRYRYAWVLPLAVWLIVVAEHITGNLADISGALPLPAEIIRTVLFDGQALPALLLIGIVVAVLLDSRILRSVGRRDGLFPAIPLRDFVALLQQRTTGYLRRIQAMRVYVRQRRSLYYSIWGGPPVTAANVQEMGTILYGLGVQAGVPLEQTFAAYERAADASPEPPATPAPSTAG
ncbi:MAG: PrsW family glutamic-type intramembrane protease [Chloroflexota bacterium]